MSRRKTFVEVVGGEIEYPKISGYIQSCGKRYKILETKKKLAGGYIGLNKPASKEASLRGRLIKTNIHNDEIILWGKLPKRIKHTTKKHELIEPYLMDKEGLAYQLAHHYSLKYEDTDLSPKEVLRICRQ
jgi:hypothetical protein